MTPDEQGRMHGSGTVSPGRWGAVKQEEDSGGEDRGLPRLEEEWFGPFFQGSSRFKIGFSLHWRCKYFARSFYSALAARHWNSPMCKPIKHMPCCRQKGHLDPISLYKGS